MGVLGVRKLISLCRVLIAKVSQYLVVVLVEWCKVMQGKYLNNGTFYRILDTCDLPFGSNLWANILKIQSIIRKGLKW